MSVSDVSSVTPKPDARAPVRLAARAGLIAALMAGVFVADTVTRLEIAVAVFHVLVILLAMLLLPRRGVILVAVACVVLTLASMLITASGLRMHESGLINGAISIAAIGITTYLALRLAAAQAAAHEARAQLARIARIRSLGELTTSIAHEVNQPLAAISASAHAGLRWLRMAPPNLERAERAVERVVADAQRASDVITRVRSLARNEAPQRLALDVNAAVIEAVAIARGEIDRHDIALAIDLEEGLPSVLADPVQLQQVLGNLVLNAVEAMQQSATRRLSLATSRDGTRVMLTVSDTGPGLSAQAQTHLFDAFWTTKEGGIGLGLTLCRAIVEAQGGTLEAQSPPAGGAVFRVSLPATATATAITAGAHA